MSLFLRRPFLITCVVVATIFSSFAFAEEWKEGEHYNVIKPVILVGASDIVLVNEFFSYGCGHCYTFETTLETWKKRLPNGVKLDPTPVIWSDVMTLHAKAFYIAKSLDVLGRMHQRIFHAMHVEKNQLRTESALRELFVDNDVSGSDFDKALNSFGVNSQVKQADALARSAKASSTPSIMVNGKYLISAREAGSQENMLKVAEFLVQKELAAKKAETFR